MKHLANENGGKSGFSVNHPPHTPESGQVWQPDGHDGVPLCLKLIVGSQDEKTQKCSFPWVYVSSGDFCAVMHTQASAKLKLPLPPSPSVLTWEQFSPGHGCCPVAFIFHKSKTPVFGFISCTWVNNDIHNSIRDFLHLC